MIIALMGKAGAGKDTAAGYFVDKYGFIEVKNAYYLKKLVDLHMKGELDDEVYWAIVQEMGFGWDDNDTGVLRQKLSHVIETLRIVDKPEMEENQRRRYLQVVLGSGLLRIIDLDVHANSTMNIICRNWNSGNPNCVVSDVRYKNELDVLTFLDEAPVSIYLDRPGESVDKVRPDMTKRLKLHSSETSVGPEDADYVFRGDGIENLLEFIDEVMEKESEEENDEPVQ